MVIRLCRFSEGVVYIPLSQGLEAKIDLQDVGVVSQYNWHAKQKKNTCYAQSDIHTDTGKRSTMLLHRLLLSPPKGLDVDHRNCDGLDNRRSNIRLATRFENRSNQRTRLDSTSGLKGVSPDTRRHTWRARIGFRNHTYYLGTYDTPELAHAAYVAASAQMHGAFGRTT